MPAKLYDQRAAIRGQTVFQLWSRRQQRIRSSLYTLLRHVLEARRHAARKSRCSASGSRCPPTRNAEDLACIPAVAATTCSGQWRLDTRVLASPPLVCNAHAGLRVPLGQDWQLGGSLFGMPARGPSRPLRRTARSRVAALWYGPPLPGGRRPLTHSPRREVVSGPATPRVPTPRLLGVSQEWRCLSTRPCFRAGS